MQAYKQSLIQRLDNLNEQCTERALTVMDMQSQRVFRLIPSLFHFNHPLIPGFFHSSVPSGVWGFEPEEIQKKFIEDMELTLGQRLMAPDIPQILGLYTMGSTSSIGQSTSSDLDIWVCISCGMSEGDREGLSNKCTLITNWAKGQGVVVNFFLMDEGRFRHNLSEEMTGDNCGSSQHLLLLDEFYRSAVRLAGKRLLWQIVPPEMEGCYEAYVAELFGKDYINDDEWIDFGRLNHIPAEEYFGASLWQLYKGINSPYKSVIKAILLEAYSWEYPNNQLLSIDTKRHFFKHDPDLYGMDAYYLMLEKVTWYLQRIGDYERLDLVRRCFYLKTHEKLSSCLGPGSVKWRREVMSCLISQWNWDPDTIESLDNLRNWEVEHIQIMHARSLDALRQSYRNLVRFVQRNDITSSISPHDISILTRRLCTSFEMLPRRVNLTLTNSALN